MRAREALPDSPTVAMFAPGRARTLRLRADRSPPTPCLPREAP